MLVKAPVAAFVVGASKGGLPMVGVLGVPILALSISPVTAAALLLPIYVASDMVGLWAYRKSYSRRNLMILVPAATLGIFIGWATAMITSERLVTLLVGVIGLSYIVNAIFKRSDAPAKPADVPRGVFWGALIGYKVTSIIPEKIFFRLVEVILALLSVKLIYDALFKAAT